MIKLLIITLFGCSCCLATQINNSNENLWQQYKTTYNKVYQSQMDEYQRRLIWEENLIKIQQHNWKYDMGLETYAMGVNHFADMKNEEFQKLFLSTISNKTSCEDNQQFLPPLNDIHLPKTVDWRTKGYVTPVKNQAQCGSCWAFSTTGSLEGQYFRKNKKLQSFSEQQLVDCSGRYGNLGCNGGLMDNAFKYIKKYGIELEKSYPYKARDMTCKFNKRKVVTKVKGFTDIKEGSEKDLQTAVATVGPISVAIDASDIGFQLYSHGVYNNPDCSSTQLDHGVLAVGYGTYHNKDYWLVKNSWASSWGDNGYIKMTRNANNQCGIATSASYPNL